MPDRDEQFNDALSDLANALQAAAPLAARQRQVLGNLAQDALILEAAAERARRAVRRLGPDSVWAQDVRRLEAAVERAVRAVRRLRPAPGATGGEQ